MSRSNRSVPRVALRLRRVAVLATMVLGILVAAPAPAQTPCTVVDNGSGTVDLPPQGCGYVSPTDLHQMINGLPPGSPINVGAEHFEFFNVIRAPGGSLGGERENFQSSLMLHLQGTGTFSGYNRTINLSAQCETHVAPRIPGDAVQSFDTDMFGIQGQLPPGDPDFDLLRITAGSGFGMPSPGHTTLVRKAAGNWNVDSFFDITYRIDFVGHPGGPFGGMSGSTTGTIRMQGGTPAPNPPPCIVPDNGGGTVNLPPPGCGYVSPQDLHKMIDGLPPGTVIQVAAEHERFFNVTQSPGGSLGGDVESFDSTLDLHLTGGGLNRTLTLPVHSQVHTGPRTPGAQVQSFNNLMNQLQGQITGDPDFDLLRITAGNAFGMPSPGHTTLTRLPSGNWNVDSFFDITYRIDFVGAPGGPLAGHSGSTTGTIRMSTGTPIQNPPPCFQPDAGGTVLLPPVGCGYVSPADLHRILNGLPPGTTIQIGAQHARFFNVIRTPGGPLGGEVETFSSTLKLKLQGTFDLGSFDRTLSLPMSCETHTGPRPPGPVQDFPNDMAKIQGQLAPGDPDFDLLRITGGTDFGMSSPGHTTLTQQPGGSWAVDSFFDVFYEIDFTGTPGGRLGGMSGSTTGTIRMGSYQEIQAPTGIPNLTLQKFPSAAQLNWTAVPGASAYDVVCGDVKVLQTSHGDFTTATTLCLDDDTPGTAAVAVAVPSPGNGLWCVVRATNIGGNGTYNEPGASQVGLRDTEIQAAAAACP